MENKEIAAEVIGDILGSLQELKSAIDNMEAEDKEWEAMVEASKTAPLIPVTSQADLFKKLKEKNVRSS